jgi:hypothetical protein
MTQDQLANWAKSLKEYGTPAQGYAEPAMDPHALGQGAFDMYGTWPFGQRYILACTAIDRGGPKNLKYVFGRVQTAAAGETAATVAGAAETPVFTAEQLAKARTWVDKAKDAGKFDTWQCCKRSGFWQIVR